MIFFQNQAGEHNRSSQIVEKIEMGT